MLGHQIGMLAQSAAGAFDLDHDGMMEQPVKQRGGDDGIAEDLAPLGKPRLEVRIIAPFSYRALTSRKKRLPPPWTTGR
jgi:hypothetical protein